MLNNAYNIKISFAKNAEKIKESFPSILEGVIPGECEISTINNNTYIVKLKDSIDDLPDMYDIISEAIELIAEINIPTELVYNIMKIDSNNYIIKL